VIDGELLARATRHRSWGDVVRDPGCGRSQTSKPAQRQHNTIHPSLSTERGPRWGERWVVLPPRPDDPQLCTFGPTGPDRKMIRWHLRFNPAQRASGCICPWILWSYSTRRGASGTNPRGISRSRKCRRGCPIHDFNLIRLLDGQQLGISGRLEELIGISLEPHLDNPAGQARSFW
jgi:hypothetical protein